MEALLQASDAWLRRTFAAGEVVVAEGAPAGSLWVLESGALEVVKGDVVVNTIRQPGALIGEMSVLLGGPYGATVRATQATVMRCAPDGLAILKQRPELTWDMAVGLAQRLNRMTQYLADLKVQYGDAPGLQMVSQVLSELSQRDGPPVRPGSRRDPDTGS